MSAQNAIDVVHLRKLRAAVWIELRQIDSPVRQRIEPHRAEKRLARLDQQDRSGKAVVVKTTPEMHARLDRPDVERVDIEPERLQRKRLHDLHEIRTEKQDTATAKADHDPELAVAFDGVEDRALEADRLAGRFIHQASDLRVE